MNKKFKINKQRCIGCGTCVQACEGATKLGDDMKAEIIDQNKLAECGGEKLCPFGAIETIDEKEASKKGQSKRKYANFSDKFFN